MNASKTWRKIFSWIVIGLLGSQIFPAQLLAAEGPATPEVAQFEPVDTTDMVNLFTGDFSYNLPLLEVPGPEGSWPINMSYHPGIGPNTEATWIGLGWTLNPGAINRFMSGLPDDYWNGITTSHYWHKKQKGWGVGLSLSYGPVGMSLSFDSQKGFGANASLSIIGAIEKITGANGLGLIGGEKSPLGFDISISAGTSGVGVSAALGISAVAPGGKLGGSLGITAGVHSASGANIGAGGGINARRRNHSSASLLGVSFSSNSGGASFSIAGTGFSSQSNASSGHFKMSSSFFPIPIGLMIGQPISAGVSYYEWEWWMDEQHTDAGFGNMHQVGYNWDGTNPQYNIDSVWSPVISDNIIDKVLEYSDNQPIGFPRSSAKYTSHGVDYYFSKKMERNVMGDVLFSSSDIYQVNVQGLSGTFQPCLRTDYYLFDQDNSDGTGKFSGVWNNGENVTFRFLDDQGGNYVASGGGGDPYSPIRSNGYGSKRVNPAVDRNTGRLVGFEIVTEDGRTYEFFLPVYSYFQYSYNGHIDRQNNADDTNSVQMNTPYATSWLLTGIKGPDYVDIGNDGYSSDDFGFWTKFDYIRSGGFVTWRTPFTGKAKTPSNSNGETYSYGAKERYYLSSIETATHIARFCTSERTDDKPPIIESFRIAPYSFTRGWDDSVSICLPISKDFLDINSQQQYTASAAILKKYDKFQCSINQDCTPTPHWQVGDNIVEATSVPLNLASAVPHPQDPGLTTFKFSYPYFIVLNQENCGGENITTLWEINSLLDVSLCLTPVGSSSGSSKARRLDFISIHKKVLDDTKTNYDETYASTAIESVVFGYEYSLCTGAPNAQSGKLTLKTISKQGVGGVLALPPTQFTYGYNPNYSADKWDLWNGYTSEGTTSNHFTSYKKSVADQDAKAWALTSILTPLGSTISVEYESDNVNWIRDSHPVPHVATAVGTGVTNTRAVSHSTTTLSFSSDEAEIGLHFSQGVTQFKLLEFSEEMLFTDYPEPCTIGNTWQNYNFSDITISSISSGQIQLTSPVVLNADTNEYCQFQRTYDYQVVPASLLLGGHRVRALSVTDGGTTKKTLYRYSDGCTPSLPSEYESKLSSLVKDQWLFSRKFNQLGPSPGVGYGKVEVMDIDASGQVLNGKTSYEFYTGKDYLFTPVETPLSYPPSSDLISIKDRTGIFGKMKNIRTYAIKNGMFGNDPTHFSLVKEELMSYQFSDGLTASFHRPNQLSSLNASVTPPGLVQQRYHSKNEGNRTKYIDHQRMNVFTVGTTSKTYMYDGSDNLTGVHTMSSENLKFDAYSGKIIATQTLDSKGRKQVSETIPAFWKYAGMLSRNMLTQLAMTKGYVLPSGVNFNSLTTEQQKKPYLTTAAATTWKDWAQGDLNADGIMDTIYRQDDSYTATRTGSSYVEFAHWSTPNMDHSAEYDFPTGWKRISNITVYDRYGHPVEERGIDGSYTSSIYSYQGALPIAIVTNARNATGHFVGMDASYVGFETNDESSYHPDNDYWALNGANEFSSDAHTGNWSRKIVAGNPTYGPTRDFTPEMPGQTRKYVVSCWVKTESGYNSNGGRLLIHSQHNGGNGNTYPSQSGAWIETSIGPTGGEWVYKEATIDLELLRQYVHPDSLLQIRAYVVNNDPSHYFLVDDIRFHPVDANMSTFAYDNLTWKVTSITDANNVTTYYEYDAAGRLSIVRDQDRKILSKNIYHYGRGN